MIMKIILRKKWKKKKKTKTKPNNDYFSGYYVFDVELEGGLSKLPFNEGGNALIAAEKFVSREKLHKGYVDDIRKFLRDNTGRNKKANNVINEQREKPKGNTQKRNEVKNVKPLINFSFPNLNFYSYDNINQEGAFKKIAVFSLRLLRLTIN